jgi:hypothetical protein
MSEATDPLISNFSNMKANFQAQATTDLLLGNDLPLPIE